MRTAFLIIAILLLLLSAGSVWLESIWVFDLIASGRLQYLVVLAMLSATALVLSLRVTAAVLIAAMLLNGWFVAEYVLSSPPERVTSDRQVSITFHNVKMNVPDFDSLRPFVMAQQTDILAFTELLARDVPAVKSAFPEFVHHAGKPGEYDVVLLSRAPLAKVRIHRLADNGKSGNTLEIRICDVADAGRCLAVLALHPTAPFTAHMQTHRDEHVWRTAGLAKEIAAEPEVSGRVAMIGDFNFTPWNVIYGEALDHGRLRDAFLQTWPHSTFWSEYAVFGLALDHIWTGRDIGLIDSRIGPLANGDHFAINARLAVDFGVR